VAAHDVPEIEIRFRTSRAGGPGGQNVNKVETRVEAVWDLDGSAAFTDTQKARIRSELHTRVGADGTIRVVSQRHRSQSRNREAAIDRLRALVAGALRPRRKRRATRPTQASRESRMESKRRRAETKRHRRTTSED
jgi:protein subunit release factor B